MLLTVLLVAFILSVAFMASPLPTLPAVQPLLNDTAPPWTLKAWDGRASIPGIPGVDTHCQWHLVKWPVNGTQHELCLRPAGDTLSDMVRRAGRWRDCDVLLSLWAQHAAQGERPVFVDAGANVGSCSVLMAANGAATLAFEPHPSNLFYFTHSALRLAEAARSRRHVSRARPLLRIFPFGAH